MKMDTHTPIDPPLVTTARPPDGAAVLQAQELAQRIGATYVDRADGSLPQVQEKAPGAPIVVVTHERVECHYKGQLFFFHPGMTKMRWLGDPNGAKEPLLAAMDLQAGDTVIDATLGLAGDAILAADTVGETGKVIGLETSPVVAEIVRLGLASYTGSTLQLQRAMRRIEVVCADHLLYLHECLDRSVDVVMFDPMFDIPLPGCQGIDALRTLASHTPLTREALHEATRVARRRVVVKSRRRGTTLEELGIEEVSGGRSSRVRYGIVRCEV